MQISIGRRGRKPDRRDLRRKKKRLVKYVTIGSPHKPAFLFNPIYHLLQGTKNIFYGFLLHGR